MVRHSTLTAACVGSNPTTPARTSNRSNKNEGRLVMRRNKIANDNAETDVFKKKEDELYSFTERYNSAISVVSELVREFEAIDESIDEKIREIDEYQASLLKIKNGLSDSKEKNKKIINTFNTLVRAE